MKYYYKTIDNNIALTFDEMKNVVIQVLNSHMIELRSIIIDTTKQQSKTRVKFVIDQKQFERINNNQQLKIQLLNELDSVLPNSNARLTKVSPTYAPLHRQTFHGVRIDLHKHCPIK